VCCRPTGSLLVPQCNAASGKEPYMSTHLELGIIESGPEASERYAGRIDMWNLSTFYASPDNNR
jgi:hypothetical protein